LGAGRHDVRDGKIAGEDGTSKEPIIGEKLEQEGAHHISGLPICEQKTAAEDYLRGR